MATDVFNSSQAQAKIIKGNKAILSIGGVGGKCLALNVQVNFTRQVQEVPALGTDRILSVGEPSGTVTIQTIIAKDANTISTILDKDKDCNGYDLTLSFQGDQCNMGNVRVELSACVTTQVSVTAEGSRGFIAGGVQITFLKMKIDEGGGGGLSGAARTVAGGISGAIGGVVGAIGGVVRAASGALNL